MKRLTENEQTAIAVANALTKQRKLYEQKITRLTCMKAEKMEATSDDPSLSVEQQYGIGMPQKESGFYWFYTLDGEGNRLESTPGICQYRSDTNEVTLIGYDVPMEYDHDRYQLIAKAVWECDQ